MKPIKVIIIGAGDRGNVYAGYSANFPEKMKVVGVAEPRKVHRQKMAEKHQILQENIFYSWEDVTAKPKFADVVVIATQDNLHTEPAIAFANLGYDILLEKPMAPTEKECRKIVEAVEKNNVNMAVCHVLRYTNYTQALKKIISEGKIGEIVSIEHLEPVGYWHHAHSFVRGNWRNEAKSTFMLLAKSCHDIDWLSYIMGKDCKAISSFGSLGHFTKENQPEGAVDRCMQCPNEIENNCPYSAKKIYLGFLSKGVKGWPLTILTPNPNQESVTEALQNGPYGRCVYACDNDVVDHQVVNMEFAGGATASFTMTAFTKATDRRTRIFGTSGEIEGDGLNIKIHDFMTNEDTHIDTKKEIDVMQGHGGGDFGIMDNFISALQEGKPEKIITGAQESLKSHLMVFAAERARKERKVVEL
jgi:predicted dehydrogenase